MNQLKFLAILALFPLSNLLAQSPEQIKGIIIDSLRQSALPYTNIVVMGQAQGTVSNEKGYFSLEAGQLKGTDSISFQYIGYQNKKFLVADLDSFATIYLKEDIINLSETFVFGDPPNPKDIIEKVLENKDNNYKRRTSVSQTFIRRKNISDIKGISIKLKKNSIPELNKRLLTVMEKAIPKHNTSYTDLYGKIYFSELHDDSLKLKPIRTVSLKGEDIADLEQIEEIFEKLLKNTKEEEYWRVKTGIFSQKMDIDDGDDDDEKEDTLKNPNEYKHKTRHTNYSIRRHLRISTLNNKDEWEFLHKTGKYNYTLAGGTRVGGEDAYIIDFTPKSGGKFIGRVFISINTYALIRSDYQYDEGKHGTSVNLFGIGYSKNQFSNSIYFEKLGEHYSLKYFSQKTGDKFSFDRKIAFQKKRERFLLDKKMLEIKVDFNIQAQNENSYELLFLDNKSISEAEFTKANEPKEIKTILVDQFDENLWKGYPIIEPTKQMRDYKKMAK